MAVEARSARLLELVEAGAAVERLAAGFGFLEGPVWNPAEGALYFSDLAADARRRWSEDEGVRTVRSPANRCNGMAYDAAGDLLVCEHVTSSLVREGRDGTRRVVASHYRGRELNSPNDLTVRSDGSIYFSDPPYGRGPVHGLERPRQLGFQGVYRVLPGDGELELVAAEEEFEMPNGLCFSPDETLLYVDDTPRAHVKVFDVRPDGSLANGRIFAEGIGSGDPAVGVVDGMKCDERGNVWVTGPGGLWVLGPDGEHLGVIAVPEVAANLAWGGPSRRHVFVTATTSLYRIEVAVGPARTPSSPR